MTMHATLLLVALCATCAVFGAMCCLMIQEVLKVRASVRAASREAANRRRWLDSPWRHEESTGADTDEAWLREHYSPGARWELCAELDDPSLECPFCERTEIHETQCALIRSLA